MKFHLLRSLAALVALALFAPRVPAQSTCHSLNDTATFLNTVSTGNAWFAIRVDLPASTTVTRIELFTGEVTALHQIDLWIHDVSTGKPLALLGSGPFPIAPTNAWQGANLAAPVALTGGQTYWIVWRAALGAQASLDLVGTSPGPLWTISVDSGTTWFTPVQSNDRQWKYRLVGSCVTPPTSYCTAGTTTNGCNATLASTGIPSASATSGFVITASHVEGQKQGLFFYSLSGAQSQPWGTGSSFLCVQPPSQRGPIATSGGSTNACDGSLTLDWNTFRASSPTILGAPFQGGESLWIQAWFRDPPAPKSTSLSNALTFIVAP
ncbi:MAG: hypothetical protein NTV21_07460 [Planctomycetota bacterium]|nr:hypothetical protein [Planctomycetota bacterium]